MEHTEEACFVYGAGDLFKVHHVMTAATFSGEEAVLDDEGKTSTYEAITSGFRFSSDVTRNTLMRL